MDWEKGRESENLEDRRRMSPKKLAVGGGIGALIIMLVGAYLGVDPQKLNQLVNQVQVAGQGKDQGQVEQRPPTAEEERSRKFFATILAFTEEVWSEQFQKAGQRYAAPHMVFLRTGGNRVRRRARGGWSLLLPGRQDRISRPHVFR